eukprot:200626-Rhodomonas_salina.2
MEPRIPASPGGGGGGGGGETKDTSAQRKAKAATQSESNNKTITHATKRKITFAKPQKKQDNDTPTPPPPIDDLKELLSTPKRMAPALSLVTTPLLSSAVLMRCPMLTPHLPLTDPADVAGIRPSSCRRWSSVRLPITLRACYAMSGPASVHSAVCICILHEARSGFDIAHGAVCRE